MPGVSRRSFLAASAALAARPAFGAVSRSSAEVDVVIVGAGAAGIAAARRIAAAGRKFVLLEATDHVGGRCITETHTFGVAYDRGAHWIHAPDFNPLTKLTPRRGIEVYPAPASQKVRIGRRYAREGELEDFLATQVRANRAIADAARRGDIACEQALPKDLADWRPSVEFLFGPFTCGKELAQVSAADFAKAAERNTNALCRQGFGALVASFAEGLSVKLSTPALTIDTGSGVTVETPKGPIAARTAIVTASTNVISSGAIKFRPELAKRQLDAFEKLSLGSYDHIALELSGGPFDFESDDLVLEKSADARTAAIVANVSGTSLCLIDVAGAFGRDLAAQGEATMVDFAADWLAGLYGADVKKTIKRSHATRWNSDPWTLGASSAAAPGAQGARRVLMEPVQNAVWFAGEAVHETLWGTVGGAWESGERAADAILHHLGPAKEPPPQPAAALKQKPNKVRSQPRAQQGPESAPNIMREETR
ncbi:MAG TPA: NAD(P)/FAD-dependent oxidoreductase [Xanthobacteraceae bacterium]|nr:NAD(P)/FAD-dependent oxidoreductase [Xanthobacteraceae bacterium]